ncbi:MAG: HAMP domain-containing histidine kinase [Spirochaetaceae bacterium]
MVKNIISTTVVLITLLFISIIQYQWLKSSAEKDISELYRNLNFTLYRSISYELKDELFSTNGLFELNYNNDDDEFKKSLEGIDNSYISDIGFISATNVLYIYTDKKWQEKEFFGNIRPEELGVFAPDPYNPGIVKFSFPLKGQEPPIHVFIYFDLLSFYRDKIEDGLDSVLQDYQFIWYFSLPEDSQVINAETYNFSPIKYIKNSLFSKDIGWLMGVNFSMGVRVKDSKDIKFRNGPMEANRPNERDFLYLDVQQNGISLVDVKEKALTIQWLLTVLLLIGLGIAYILILNQINKLKILRAREKEFVASVTHELRTPLAVIHSAADNIKSGIIDPKRMEQYGTLITDQSRRLSSMIEGILLFSRFEGKAIQTPHLTSVKCSDLEDELETINESIADKYGVKVLLDFGLPETFYTDIESVELILSNLIINSAKHGYSDGGVIRVKAHLKLPNKLIFVIEDDGVGIDIKEQRHIFEPFFRGVKSHENQTNGSGLGLFLTYKKVKLLGGKISLESPYNRADAKSRSGCKFTVTIPFSQVDKDEKSV